jgi:catechol 2,3-dioxygenase-like lactoylglutathione lyase family enzyme
MALTVSAMFISVHDPDAALGFYRDALGLEVRAGVASEGFRWVTRWRPRAERRHRSVPAAQPSFEGRGRRPPVTRDAGVAAGCDLPSADLDATFREGSDVGGRGARGAGVSTWGARDCALRDPGQPRPHPGAALSRPAIAVMTCTDRAVRR